MSTGALMYDSRQPCAPPYDNVTDAASAQLDIDKRNVIRHFVDLVEEEEVAPRPHPERLIGSSRRKRRFGVQLPQEQLLAAAQDKRSSSGGGDMSTKSMGPEPTRQRPADDGQQYCLRWNNHRSNLLTVFEQLLQTEAFTDVTLAVGGTSIKCHKMVLAACSSYFQSLFLENACPHPIVVFKDIQYAEIRAILEYMYRGEVNVAQEQLPSLLKVAEALRVKGLFEDDSLSADYPATAQPAVNVTSGRPASRPSSSSTPSSSPPAVVHHQVAHPIIRGPTVQRSKSPTLSRDQESYSSTRHPYYKSPLLSPQGSEQGRAEGNGTNNPLSMWPPLVMPLHLGAFESALREREQALALYGAIQRGGSGSNEDPPSGNGNYHHDGNNSNGTKRKRLSSAADSETPSLLRTVLGPHKHGADIPGLFPFRSTASADGSGSTEDRNHLGYLPMAMAYAERQAGRDRDDDWNQNPDMNSEDDPNEIVSSGDYGHNVPSSPLSDKRDASGARIAAYVPTQKLEWKRYKQYTNSDITAAIEAVKSGMSALQASRKFKVPSRTLYDKVKKLGIATTRPYSRVSSSTSSAANAAAAAALNAANQNNFAASTAALTSAMAAAALSLVKRERGPVIQVAGSSRHEAAVAAAASAIQAEDLPADYSEDSRQESPENLTIGSSNHSTSSPGSGNAASNGKDIKKETPDSTPTPPPAPQSPPRGKLAARGAYFAVRDDLNSTTTVMEDRSASPNPSTT